MKLGSILHRLNHYQRGHDTNCPYFLTYIIKASEHYRVEIKSRIERYLSTRRPTPKSDSGTKQIHQQVR